MKRLAARAAFVAVLALLCASVGTPAHAQYSRKSPIVHAVEKTKASIVTVLVAKQPGQSRDTVGSGVVIDERGYIVTNAHVVSGQTFVTVQTHDGERHVGRVMLAEPSQDLAVVHVQAGGKLAALTLAPVSDLMVGETVIAVGHPFGYTNTVSVGIISALDRSVRLPGGHVLRGVIQTDASINPGNSGGPLLNINGELIGINVALRDGAQGIAFAINAGTVRELLAERLSALRVAGVGHGIECDEKVLSEAGDRQRAVVAAIDHNTPADRAGLRKGDEIVAVGGRRVVNRFDIERSLWDAEPGQHIRLRVRRGSAEIHVTMTLEKGHTISRRTRADAPPAAPAGHSLHSASVKTQE
jgi:serine protease Do